MPEYQIEGPDQDGNYWYRGWRLELGQCNGPDSIWFAYNRFEATHEDIFQLWLASGGTGPRTPVDYDLARHCSGDNHSGVISTIQSCIDQIEAEVERQFRANLAVALKGE